MKKNNFVVLMVATVFFLSGCGPAIQIGVALTGKMLGETRGLTKKTELETKKNDNLSTPEKTEKPKRYEGIFLNNLQNELEKNSP